jgi:hypothetical protein
MNTLTRSIATATCSLIMVAASAAAQTGDAADSLYRRAQQALADNDYARSATMFKQVADQYARSAHAGEALYWQAWALYHTGTDRNSRADLDAAAAALERQQRSYSPTVTADARDLAIRIRTAQARLGDASAAASVSSTAQQLDTARGCPDEDDDMRIVALQGLMSMDAESAVPILKQVLARRGACTEELRKRAVFILSQKSGSADVTPILLDVARGDPSSEVRGDAIQWLGQSHSVTAVAALDSVLFASQDEDIQHKALFALSQSRSDRATQALKRAAADTRLSEDVRGTAVFWLGQSRLADLDFFRTLFRQSNSDDIHGKIFMAVAQSRSAEGMKWLMDLARDSSVDTESRKRAIFWAGQNGIDIAQMVTLYDQVRPNEELQEHILFTLSQRREDAALDKLFSIAKSDPNVELRKKAVFWIGQKNDPRARAFLLELIKG